MKLLFDQNLSFKLCALLSDLFPDSKPVRDLGLDRSDDRIVWQHAKLKFRLTRQRFFHRRIPCYMTPNGYISGEATKSFSKTSDEAMRTGEQHMMRAAQPRTTLTQEDWKKQRGLLRFGITAERLTGLPLFPLVYPYLTLAKTCNPRELAREDMLTTHDVRLRFAERIQILVEKMGIIHETSGSVDERWYWLAPMLLDFVNFPQSMTAWWESLKLWETSTLLEVD